MGKKKIKNKRTPLYLIPAMVTENNGQEIPKIRKKETRVP